MRFRVLTLLCVCFLAQPVWAVCQGTDLRPTLVGEEATRLAEALADAPYPVGNHWRATRDGKAVHLIGTMHLADPRLDAPIERLRGVVESADLLLLEMTSDDQAAMQARLASDPAFLLMQDTTLPELLSEEDWAQMSDALSARGLPPFMAARFQPWYVSIVLAIPPCASLDELSGGGLDARLEEIAMEAGVPRAALEDAQTIFEAFADQPRETQINMMLSALVDPEISEDLFATLLASYFDEATAESWATSAILAERYSPIDQSDAGDIFGLLEQTLLVERNRDWIPVILDAVADNDLVVAAFGAAHLPGHDGVIALLAAEGFEIERLPF